MNTILDYVCHWAEQVSDKPAIIHHDGSNVHVITYSQLYRMMAKRDDLPIPLLGESWDGDFCLYTTGTTGKSKGVVISQKAVIANSENLIAGQGYHRDLVFILIGNFDHLGCWSKIFPVLIEGASLYVIDGGMKNIELFFTALDMSLGDYNLSPQTTFATFLVPSNIGILVQLSGTRLANYSDRIEFIETGAAPMPHALMEQLCTLLPHSRLFNTYASTETGVVCTYNYNDGRQLEGCLGRPLSHSSVVISDEGRIICSGDTLMTCYKDEPEQTSAVLHDGIFYTSDNGYIDDDGMLHILGRADDMINVGGFKVSPLEIENAARTIEIDNAYSAIHILDCICIAMPHHILGQALCLLVVLPDGITLTPKMMRFVARSLASKLDTYKLPQQYRQVTSIHRNINGKLDRMYYRQNIFNFRKF